MNIRKTTANNNSRRGEQGIAILFTLGILSLLLVMALAFATNSIIERKAAFNNNSRTQARLIARSALNRALAMMKFYNQTQGTDYFNEKIISRETATDHTDGLHNLLATSLNGNPVYTAAEATATDVSWQYVSDGTRILGRFAYIALPDTGKVDPSAMVDDGGIDEGLLTRGRPGRDVSELYLSGLSAIFAEGAGGSANLFGRANSSGADPGFEGKLPAGTRWTSFEQMFKGTGVTTPASKGILRHYFMLDNQPDIEAFWGVPGGTAQKSPGAMYHRFDLTRGDWDTGLGAGANSDAAVNRLLSEDADPPLYSAATNDNAGIYYLRKMVADAGTFPDIETRRRQIAANIIDYCDADNIATSDVAGNWTAADRPTYTGNEKTFLVNRIGFYGRIDSMARLETPIPPAPATHKEYHTTFTGFIGAELVNIYGNAVVDGNYTLDIGISVTITITDEDGNAYPGTYNTPVSLSILTQTADQCLMVWSAPFDIPINTAVMEIGKTIRASGSIIFDYAILQSPDGNADFCNLANTINAAHDFYPPTDALDNATTDCWACFASLKDGDPLQNLNAGDWEVKAAENYNMGFDPTAAIDGAAHMWVYNDGTTTYTYNTGGVDYTMLTPARPANTGGKDTEDLSNFPDGISTAYIRNAPMLSPWELGAIHRGVAWETINLKKFNSAIDYTIPDGGLNDAGGSYAAGDAGILDQVKISGATQTYGLINLNNTNDDILRTLTYMIYPESGYADPGTQAPGSPVSYADAGAFATLISGTSGLYRHRAEVANAIESKVTADYTNDAQQEAIIGKFINLTKAYEPPGEIRLIVVAQAIQDIGGPSGSPITITRDGQTRACELNVFDLQGGVYFDEIIGECKMLVTISRNPATNRYIVRKIEYLQD